MTLICVTRLIQILQLPKIAQIGDFERIAFKKKPILLSFGYLLGTFGLLFISTSGHTGPIKVLTRCFHTRSRTLRTSACRCRRARRDWGYSGRQPGRTPTQCRPWRSTPRLSSRPAACSCHQLLCDACSWNNKLNLALPSLQGVELWTYKLSPEAITCYHWVLAHVTGKRYLMEFRCTAPGINRVSLGLRFATYHFQYLTRCSDLLCIRDHSYQDRQFEKRPLTIGRSISVQLISCLTSFDLNKQEYLLFNQHKKSSWI